MKYIFTVLVFWGLFGCNNDHEGFSVSGNIENVEDGKLIYVSKLDQNNQPQKLDSVAVQNGEFSLDLPDVDSPNLSFLTVDDTNGNILFISENEPIHFEIYKDSLPASKVSGGKENKLFYDYLNHLKDLNRRVVKIRNDMRQQMTSSPDSATMAQLQQEEAALRDNDIAYKKKLVKENPNAFVSVLILTDMQNMGVPSGEVREYFEMLPESLQQTSLAQTLKTNLDRLSATEIGAKAPDFSGPNPEGEELALEDLMGKVTLIDFWAAWCRPCRDENPNIVQVYEKYHDQGFNVIGISLDREGQKDRWVQAIEDDNLDWPQISHLQFWQDPIAQKYGIDAIPAAFILDENGIIVAKNVRGEELEPTIKKLLEE